MQPGQTSREGAATAELFEIALEGLNNKIRVIQRRSFGLRGEEYLRLKILTCMLPPL